jgi:hypothetical protein
MCLCRLEPVDSQDLRRLSLLVPSLQRLMGLPWFCQSLTPTLPWWGTRVWQMHQRLQSSMPITWPSFSRWDKYLLTFVFVTFVIMRYLVDFWLKCEVSYHHLMQACIVCRTTTQSCSEVWMELVRMSLSSTWDRSRSVPHLWNFSH